MSPSNTLLIALSILYSASAFSQTTVKVPLGDKTVIPIKIDTESRCNLLVFVGKKEEQHVVEPPSSEIKVSFEATELGNTEVKWEGKFRARGLKSVAGCSTAGSLQVETVPNADQRKAEWGKLFSSLSVEQSNCVKSGLRLKNVTFESIDPQANLESPSAKQSRDVFGKCDSFTSQKTIWGSGNKDDFACRLLSGEHSRCRGVYAERLPDGRLRTITFDEAVKRHFSGEPWTTGQIELQKNRQEREEALRIAQEKAEIEKQARKEAEEREKKWKESPEYKRQQAELERKRQAEVKAAEERIRQEKERADLAEKQQRAEQEKRQREAAEKARIDRENYAKEFPYYALITCGFQQQHMNIHACFSGRVGTEIELRNGNQYGLYKVYEIHRLGQEMRNGFKVNLRREFELRAQNSSDTLTLGVVIIDVKTEKVLFQQQVARFGVISIRN